MDEHGTQSATSAEGFANAEQSAMLSRALASVVDDMPMGVAVFDRDLRLTACNRVWLEFAERYTPDRDAVQPGAGLFDIIPSLEPLGTQIVERVLVAGETVAENALPIPVGDGLNYWDHAFSPLRGTDGDIEGVVTVAIDATDRVLAFRRVEQRVHERTAELQRRREVAEGLHDVLAILNSSRPLNEVVDYIIDQARALLGADLIVVHRLDECCGLQIELTRGLEDAIGGEAVDFPGRGEWLPFPEGRVAELLLSREPIARSSDSSLLDREAMAELVAHFPAAVFLGQYRSMLIVPIIVGEDVTGGVGMYFAEERDFSEQEISLASDLADHLALAIENAQLREQAENAAVLAERSRIARDLHDAVTQTLFSASLIAEVLPRLWRRVPGEAERRLEEMRRLTRGALAEMRTLLLELRPQAIVEASLGDVLRQLADAASSSGVDVEVVESGQTDVPADVKIALYRIAQEALNNVAKHSGATSATVTLELTDDRAHLEIADNGTGFDMMPATGDHHGTRIMKERAEGCGGTLDIESSAGAGTRITVACPLEAEEA